MNKFGVEKLPAVLAVVFACGGMWGCGDLKKDCPVEWDKERTIGTVIGFMDDYSIWQTGAYQFTINNQSHRPSPLDYKLRETILLLIEAFFKANPDILLYICETGDGKQAMRSRLFIRWFNTYSHRDAYILETAVVMEGETKNFAALIVQKSNPRLTEIVSEFRETISILTNKPE